jgi:hypothetical protein
MNATNNPATISITPTPKHERVARNRQHPGDQWRQVLIPVHEEMKEFVGSGDERRNHEREAKNLIRLIGRTLCPSPN